MKMKINGKVYDVGPRANLTRSNLYGADLTRADLTRADLTRANLTRADLTRADLTEADLTEANLTRADLTEANLTRAELYGANLTEANLTEAILPAPSMILLSYLGKLSDGLTADLMAYDASMHPNPQDFTDWANGGNCPYQDTLVQRAANFIEKKELWDPNRPLVRPYDLMVRALTELKCKPFYKG